MIDEEQTIEHLFNFWVDGKKVYNIDNFKELNKSISKDKDSSKNISRESIAV